MFRSQAAPSHVIPAAFSAAPPLIGTLPFVTTKRTDGTWESVIQELLDMRLVGYLYQYLMQ